MEKVSLIRRERDCGACGSPWIRLQVGEHTLLDCCTGLLAVGENLHCAEFRAVMENWGLDGTEIADNCITGINRD